MREMRKYRNNSQALIVNTLNYSKNSKSKKKEGESGRRMRMR